MWLSRSIIIVRTWERGGGRGRTGVLPMNYANEYSKGIVGVEDGLKLDRKGERQVVAGDLSVDIITED